MTYNPRPDPAAPTAAQLAELGDALATAAELERLYAALVRHPAVLATPGSRSLFLACHDQVRQDMRSIEEQLGGLFPLAQAAAGAEEEGGARLTGTLPLLPRALSLPDVEPLYPGRPVFDAVQRATHLEDFLRQQLKFALASARQRRQLKLELRMKMILLSARQRGALLEERYRVARGKTSLLQGLREETTRLLGLFRGEARRGDDD